MADNFITASAVRLASGSLSLDGDSDCLLLVRYGLAIDTLASGIVAATQQIVVHTEKCNHLAHKTHLLVTALHDYVTKKLEEDIANANSELMQSIDKVIAVFERVHKRLREYTEYSRVETLLKVSEVENGLNTCVSDLNTNGFFPSPPSKIAYLRTDHDIIVNCSGRNPVFLPVPYRDFKDLFERDTVLRFLPFRQPSDFLTETVSYLKQQLFLTRNRDWTLLSWCPWAGTTRDVPL